TCNNLEALQSQQSAVAVLRSITQRAARWTGCIFFTFLFGMLCPPDLQSATCSVPIDKDVDTGQITAFHEVRNGTLLIGAGNGFVRVEGDKLTPINRVARYSHAFHAAGDGTLLIGTGNGLFRLDGDKVTPIGNDTRWIFALHELRNGTLL